MRGCVRLSNGPREPDGFHILLQDEDQNMFDLATDREARHENRDTSHRRRHAPFSRPHATFELDGDAAAQPVAQAISATRVDSHRRKAIRLATGRPIAGIRSERLEVEPDAMAQVVDVLRDAGVLTAAPRGLLE